MITYQTIYKRTKRGKVKIFMSKAEQECFDILKSIPLVTDIKKQPKLKYGGRSRYDFSFIYNENSYILEVDGAQHFAYSSFIHRTIRRFSKGRTQDIKKTFLALLHGYSVIRIHSRFIKDIPMILKNSLDENNVLYTHPIDKYQWLIEAKIRQNWLTTYASCFFP